MFLCVCFFLIKGAISLYANLFNNNNNNVIISVASGRVWPNRRGSEFLVFSLIVLGSWEQRAPRSPCTVPAGKMILGIKRYLAITFSFECLRNRPSLPCFPPCPPVSQSVAQVRSTQSLALLP